MLTGALPGLPQLILQHPVLAQWENRL